MAHFLITLLVTTYIQIGLTINKMSVNGRFVLFYILADAPLASKGYVFKEKKGNRKIAYNNPRAY